MANVLLGACSVPILTAILSGSAALFADPFSLLARRLSARAVVFLGSLLLAITPLVLLV